MAPNIVSGILEKISTRNPKPGLTMYNVTVEGHDYGCGPFPVRNVSEGERVQFEVEMRGSFKNVKQGTLKKYEPVNKEPEPTLPTSAPSTSTPTSTSQETARRFAQNASNQKDDYWVKKEQRDIEREKRYELREEDKQKRITFDSSRKAAMEYVALLASTDSLWLKKMDKAKDKMEYIEGLVNDLTRKFYQQAEARDKFLGNQPLFDEDLSLDQAVATGLAEAEDAEWK